MDAFAVSVASSVVIGKITGRHIFRLAFHFGLFQALMPVIGWLAGRSIQQYIYRWDHWIAFALLSFIGIKAIREAVRPAEKSDDCRHDPSRGISLVILSTATSIDALAVGLSFAMLEVDIWYPALVIGIITAALSVLAVLLGGKIGTRFGKKMEITGGIVLILIGLKILFDHLLML